MHLLDLMESDSNDLQYLRFFLCFFFILVHMSTSFSFRYPIAHLRFIILYLIVILFYFVLKSLLYNVELAQLEKMLLKGGIMGGLASLTYYFVGLTTLLSNSHSSNIKIFWSYARPLYSKIIWNSIK